MSEAPRAVLEPPSPKSLLDASRRLQSRMIDLRRRIHAEPEVGLQNTATRDKIVEELADLDLDLSFHRESSGLVAVLRGSRPGRRVLLRGDTDALPMTEETDLPFRSKSPGRMHSCGHDAHTAMLVGAARLLEAHRDSIEGEIVLMFQPGEETYGGARVMLEEGMPEVDGAFAIHVAPQIPTGMIASRPGAIMASFDDFHIDICGRGGHASMPHDCIDPVPIACEIVSALQSFMTRRVPATDPGVITVTEIHGGTANNVIADSVRISGTMRALSDATRALLLDGLPRIAEGVARTHEATARVQVDPGYPVAVNDAPFESFARDIASEIFGPNAVISLPHAVMGAEDFAYVLDRIPGAMLLLGARPPGGDTPAPCHSSRMLMNEDAMPFGAALHASIALRYLGRGPGAAAGGETS